MSNISISSKKGCQMQTNNPLQPADTIAIGQAFQQAMQHAIACHQAGRLDEAEHIYRSILQIDSTHANVHYNLGVLSVQKKQPAAGLPHFITALNIDPTRQQYWLSYIDALRQSGKSDDASGALALARQYGLEGDEVDTLAECLRVQAAEQSNARPQLVSKMQQPAAPMTSQSGKKKHGQQKKNVLERKKNPDSKEIDTLLALFNERNFEEAAAIALAMTIQFPLYGFGWKALGTIFRQMGRQADALLPMQKAVALLPNDAETHNNLGSTFHDLGRMEEAKTGYLHALKIKPDYAEAHSNLGSLMQDMKYWSEAEANFNKAIALNPGFAEYHYNLGNTLKEMGRLDDACASYRRAIQIRPDYAEAYNNLGVACMMMSRLEEAEASCRQAIRINPDFAFAHNNLGNILNNMKRPNEAVACYLKAVEISPGSAAEIYNNLAGVMRRPDDAMKYLRMAIKLKPDYAEAYNTMGNAELMRGRLDDSVTCFRQALKSRPDYAIAHSNLIYALDLMECEDVESLQAERKNWDVVHGAPFYKNWAHDNNPDPERRLRIGYVSADIKDHSATKVFGGMLVNFDREQFDVYAYSNFKGMDDNFTEYFKSHVTVWRSIVGLSDDATAELIRQDQIDILVDLSGHSAGNRLLVFARKPAPIQITAWGYASGTGMRAMDVFFSDSVMVPPHEKKFFAEDVRYLPCVVGAFYSEPFPDVNELPALRQGIITFGSHNRLTKLSPEACRVWAKVLLGVPGSRLILKSPEAQDPATRERITGHFTKAGVAAERIIMQGGTTWYGHMQAYNQIDIALDPFPHGGGVTTVEGLMMGVPVVAQLWQTMPGRVSASVMTALGLSDWVAGNSEQFVELAVRKASDLQALAELRQRLRGILTSSEMGNTISYVRAVEREYRTLWREWCEKSKPEMKTRNDAQ
jgi:protein O-GlcNAc transferase